jgi:DNA-binding NtrC family response regulator
MLHDKPLILVLDQDTDELTDLYALLDGEGYLVATRLSGIEGLKYVSQHKPELVIISERTVMDEQLELVTRIKAMSPLTHVVLLSTHGDWPQFIDTLDRGGDDLLRKPLKPEEILRSVSRVMERVRREHEPLALN